MFLVTHAFILLFGICVCEAGYGIPAASEQDALNDVEAPAYVPSYAKSQQFSGGYSRSGYGTKTGYSGTKTHYTGTKTGYTGTKTGYTGTKTGYTGTKTGYTGTKTGYTGTKTGYTGTNSGYNTGYSETRTWNSESGSHPTYQDLQHNANQISAGPKCEPTCKNNGICIDTNTCHCPANFQGKTCEFEKKPCLTYPPLPMNSGRKCNSELCTITCIAGHKFIDGTTVANMRCVDGQWQPTRADLTSIPDCEPECSPPCLNGGVCLSVNTCQCPTEYRGPQCQYSTSVCDFRKLAFNGNYKCKGNDEEFSCILSCPPGATASATFAGQYTCLYSTGTYTPQPIPHCVFNEVVIVTPSNYLSGYSSSYYETYYHNGSSSHSQHRGYGHGDRESVEYGALSGGVKGTNVHIVVQDFTPKGGTCLTWAGVHYKTFDGKIYSFESPCQHILVQDAKEHEFTVAVRQGSCGRRDYCPLELTIYLEEKPYVLSAGEEEGSVVFRSSRRLLPIPASLPGLRVSTPGDYVLVSLDAVGLVIKWDTNNVVVLESTVLLWNNTQGLCGRLDGNPENDFTTKEGTIAKTKAVLASSWQVKKIGDVCDSSPSEPNACAAKSEEERRKAQQFCTNVFVKDKFRKCSSVMDVTQLLETCQWDYCACTSGLSPEQCACNTVSVYAKECQRLGVQAMRDWRDADTCPMKCTEGKIYKSCGPDVQPSCQFPNPSPADPATCVEGCFCPEGLLLEAGKCVPKEECPCRLRNKSFKPGSVVKKDCNTCTCQAGEWVCTSVACGARCGAVGDPHYTTFDGLRYDFMGHCTYTLLQAANVTVEVENVACSGSISEEMNLTPFKGVGKPSCTKAVNLKYNGVELHLKQGGFVLVNGKEVATLPVHVGDVLIRAASSLFLIVQLPNGLDLWWDGNTRVFVDVPPTFHDKTKGLCGTFNLNQKDDFLTPEGDTEQTALAFANKWKTREVCADVDVVEPEHPCKANIENKEAAEKYCSRLKSKLFEPCHWHVPVTPYYEECVYDMCACAGDAARCLCPILGDYAMACAKSGVNIQWRYNVKECELSCSGGQEYTVCADSCQRTCSDIGLSARTQCRPCCVEGCACPVGQVLDASSACVPVGLCPCFHKGMQFDAGYKEVRAGRRERELCTCVGARWECVPATPRDIQQYPPAEDLRSNCSAASHMEFTTCEVAEPLTCKNMHLPPSTTTKECRPGCQCKRGYVLDAASHKCVLATECPCHHGGRSFPDGHEMQEECNKCKCENGNWVCSELQCPGVCSAWGDSHVSTFDGKEYEFEGVCTYLLAKGSADATDGFEVQIQNAPCGTTGATCSKSATLKVGSGQKEEIVQLTKDAPLPDLSKLERIKLRIAGVYVFLDVPSLGISLQWDRGMRVYVKVDPMWRNRVKGLCGNYNSDARDDFEKPEGGIAESSVLIFADSWKLKPTCPKPTEVEDHCRQRPERKDWASSSCGALKRHPFTLCHSEVPPGAFVAACERDACACDAGDDCACVCTALAAYARRCAERGVLFKWRTPERCPIQCDETCATYEPCLSPCPEETCENTYYYKEILPICQRDTCVEGCKPKEDKKQCPEGEIVSNSTSTSCVSRGRCKPVCMTLPDGKQVLEGEVLEQDACHTCRCSKKQRVCTGQPCSTEAPSIPPVVMTTPHDEPMKCLTGWTPWVNRGPPETAPGGRSVDKEPLPKFNELQIGQPMCAKQNMSKINCRTTVNHQTPKETGLDVECSLEEGLVCSEAGNVCPDFEIQVYCQCEEEEEGRSLPEPPVFQCLDSNHPNYAHPSDCNKFYECTPDLLNPKKPHSVLKACPEGLMYSKKNMVCDWPASVTAERPECKDTATTPAAAPSATTPPPASPSATTPPPASPSATTPPPASRVTASPCPPGQVHKQCAYPCESLCDHFKKTVIKKGLCKYGEKCIAGCVDESVANIKCEFPSRWRDEKTCVPLKDCTCYYEGQVVKPGGVVGEDCKRCQCLEDALHCDTSECVSVAAPPPGPSHLPMIFPEPATPATPPTRPSTTTTTVAPLIVKTTVSPPPECSLERYRNLLWSGSPLPASAFTASSADSAHSRPQYAELNGQADGDSAGSWNAAIQDTDQFIQVELPTPQPIYGVILQGSPMFDQYVTSYEVMYGDDGHVFSYVQGPKGDRQVFRGPVEHTGAVKQMFAPPIEAKFVRIKPLTWHDSIAVRFELVGCGELTTITTTPQPTTLEPMQCTEPLGLAAELPLESIEVSSNNDDRQHFALAGQRGWRPLYSTPGEWIMFDFTAPRNITGVKTAGGAKGWVTAYSIMYSSDLTTFNPVVDAAGAPAVFPANFDKDTVVTTEFRPPIHARYLKVLPAKWKDNIEMRVEPIGCFEPYPVGATTLAPLQCTEPLGLAAELPLESIEVSSNNDDRQHFALAGQRGWRPLYSTPGEWIMFDFTAPRNITGVKTAGGAKGWVTAYSIMYSSDLTTFNPVVDAAGAPAVFPANFDKDTVVTTEFRPPIHARYLKVLPAKWKDNIEMRVEPIGCFEPYPVGATTLAPLQCTEPLGLAAELPLESIEVSSNNDDRQHFALAGQRGWRPLYSTPGEWIMFDFTAPRNITGVKTAGGAKGWVTAYSIMYSSDLTTFNPVVDAAGAPAVFPANFDKDTVVTTEFRPPIHARYLKVLPAKWKDNIEMRVEPIGCFEPYPVGATTLAPLQCTEPLGLAAELPLESIEVSSNNDDRQHFALAGQRGWRPLYSTPGEWIMFDFTAPRNITGVKTAGGAKGWVTAYSIMYSSDLTTFNPVVDAAGAPAVFPANFDKDTVVTTEFRPPIHARYLKVLPAKWKDNIEMRVEPIGCFEPYPTTPPRPSESPFLPTTEACVLCPGVRSAACSCHNGTAKYFDGDGCVTRDQCPCVEGFMTYAVGSAFHGTNCDECVCKLGGVTDCKPVKECKCASDLVPKLTATCSCACSPCPAGTRICRTSKLCLPRARWCDGLQDCPDDERGCASPAPTAATTVEAPVGTTLVPTAAAVQTTTAKRECNICRTSKLCLPRARWCDGLQDCPDDERGCASPAPTAATTVEAPVGTTLVPTAAAVQTTTAKRECNICRTSKLCLPRARWCDGLQDCPDDERGCASPAPTAATTVEAPVGTTLVPTAAAVQTTTAKRECNICRTSKLCLPRARWCDGLQDCPDDERGCASPAPTAATTVEAPVGTTLVPTAAAVQTTTAKRECNICRTSKLCLPRARWCDGLQDCPDDERGCASPAPTAATTVEAPVGTTLVPTAAAVQTTTAKRECNICRTSKLCLPRARWCDGLQDCPDDERGCASPAPTAATTVEAPVGTTLVPTAAAVQTTTAKRECNICRTSKLCLPRARWCDGLQDCPDDERGCASPAPTAATTVEAPVGTTLVPTAAAVQTTTAKRECNICRTSKLCLPRARWCDGLQDCPDDERGCASPAPTAATTVEAPVGTTLVPTAAAVQTTTAKRECNICRTSKLCLPRARWCDGLQDCPDDERGCASPAPTAATTVEAPVGTTLVPTAAAVQTTTAKRECNICRTSKLCLPRARWCDGLQDCPDDERGCASPAPTAATTVEAPVGTTLVPTAAAVQTTTAKRECNICRTSKLCLPRARWCDGLQDCPDDERGCASPAPTAATTVEAPVGTTLVPTAAAVQTTTAKPVVCEEVTCPPGYLVRLTSASRHSSSSTSDLPPPRPRVSYRRYQTGFASKGGYSKGGFSKGGFSKGGFSKGGYGGQSPQLSQSFTLDKAAPAAAAAAAAPASEQQCQQFKCVPKLPPLRPGVPRPPQLCSTPACPPGYSLRLEAVAVANECPQYGCVPPPERPQYCNVTGRTFNTFDGSEYKYDICYHILARETKFGDWTIILRKKCRVDGCANQLLVSQDDQLILVKPSLMIEYDNFEYSVEQTNEICFQKNSFDISKMGNGLSIKSRKYNFIVLYNTDGDVKVGIYKSHHLKHVDGLCGYFDGSAANDRRLPGGAPAASVDEFGRAWARPGLSPRACETNVIPPEKQKRAWDLCDVITKEPLSKCAKVLNLELWRSICLEKLCKCTELLVNGTRRTEEECRCLLVEKMVAECLAADRDLDVAAWRINLNCPAECPPPLVHYDCYSKTCEPTCSTSGARQACAAQTGQCFPGCYCPEGKLRKGDTCVTPQDCLDCNCHGQGSPAQYTTFEKDEMPFFGNCTYLASRDRNETGQHRYEVYATSGLCEARPGAACTRAVHVVYEKNVVHVTKDPVTKKLVTSIGGSVVFKYPVKKDWVTIAMVNKQDVVVKLHDAFVEVAVLNAKMEFGVRVPSRLYADATEGLCGACAGQRQDLRTSNGTVTGDVELYGKSWQASASALATLGMSPQEQCDQPPPPEPECVPPPPDQNVCYNLLDKDKFGRCMALVDPQPFLEACEQDVCANATELCAALEGYAGACRRQGECLDWRGTLCPTTCEPPFVYRACDCERTCDNRGELERDPDKCDRKPEGCFCPEGKVRVENTCIEPTKCFPCDANKEHYAGDEWQEDACTTCTCSKLEGSGAAHVACTQQACAAPVCAPGEDLLTSARAQACCPDYLCVKKPADNPVCEEPKKMECGFGQVLKQKTTPTGCKEFTCECKPASECEHIPTESEVEIMPGMQRLVDTSGCCPRAQLLCRPDTCPAPAACPPLHRTRAVNVTGACCLEYKCELPADKCLVTLEWEAAPKGGEKPRSTPQTMLKDLDAAWLDGPCRSCRCSAAPASAPAPAPAPAPAAACDVTACAALASSDQFVVEPRPVPFACCPVAAQVACRAGDTVYRVGENWTNPHDVCESYQCVEVEQGKLEKVTTVQTCPKDCEPGWKYFPAEPSSQQCCGRCKPVACVCGGVERPIGAAWHSPDLCTNYTCVLADGNLQVQTSNETCPEASVALKKQFVLKEEKPAGKCCKTQEPVACRVGNDIYQEGQTWPSPDPCKTYTCARDGTGRLAHAAREETCAAPCAPGWRRAPPAPGACCGHCAQEQCVLDEGLKDAGTSWKSADNCTTYSCERSGDDLLLTSSHVPCPDVTSCAPEDLVNETCCAVCKEKPASLSTCYPEEVPAAETVGLLRVTLRPHGACVNTAPVPGFRECRGSCRSGTLYNNQTGSHDSQCECCQATKYAKVTATLRCEDGSARPHVVASPLACGCRACGDTRAKDPANTGYSGVKTGVKAPQKREEYDYDIPEIYARMAPESRK